MYILSQVLIVLSDFLCIAAMLSKSKRNIVIFFILSTILFGSHYMCLGAWTGAAIAGVELIFLILMYILEIENKTKFTPYLCIITIIISVILSILTWNKFSVLPMIAMLVYVFSMMFKNVIIVKSGAFIRLILNAIYMLLLKSYFGSAFSILILIFSVVGIINDVKAKKTPKLQQEQNQNVQQ